MSTNLMLSYGGATPAQALTGSQPRELYDFEIMLSLRHLCPHVGFVWWCISRAVYNELVKNAALDVMERIDANPYGQVTLSGSFWAEDGGIYKHSPVDLGTFTSCALISC